MSKIDLKDYAYSNTATTRCLDNSIPEKYRLNAEKTVERFNAIQSLIGRCRLTSGYRCLVLNELVGGVVGSKHLQALACDFVPEECSLDTALLALQHLPCVTYAYIGSNYIHVSFK